MKFAQNVMLILSIYAVTATNKSSWSKQSVVLWLGHAVGNTYPQLFL